MPLKILVIDPNPERGGLIERALEPDELSVVLTPTLEEGLGALLKGGFSLMMLAADFGSPPLTAWWNQAEAVARGIPAILLGSGEPGGVPIAMVVPDPVDPAFLAEQVRSQLGIRPKPKAPPAEASQAAQAAAQQGAGDPLAALGHGPLTDAPLVSPAEGEIPAAAASQAETPDAGFLEPTSLDAGAASEMVPPTPEAAPAAAPSPKIPPIPEAAETPPSSRLPDEVEMEMAGMSPERIQEVVAEIARQTVEKVVWETVPPLVNRLIQEKQEEQDRIFAQIVERVVWETVPPMAENIVKQEVRRLSDGA